MKRKNTGIPEFGLFFASGVLSPAEPALRYAPFGRYSGQAAVIAPPEPVLSLSKGRHPCGSQKDVAHKNRYITFASVLLLFLAGCSTEVVQSTGEGQANQILAVLGSRGIKASKSRAEGQKKDGWRVMVRSGDFSRAVEVLNEKGLPRPVPKGFAETFSKGSIIPTPVEERAMMIQAVTGELERTLESIDGVTLARVHVVLPGLYEGERGRTRLVPSAAVLLKVAPGASPDKAAIRRIVARSSEGLSDEAVTVEVFEGAAIRPAMQDSYPSPWTTVPVAASVSLACGLGAFVVLSRIRRKASNSRAARGVGL
jgi:type III secretion protein J